MPLSVLIITQDRGFLIGAKKALTLPKYTVLTCDSSEDNLYLLADNNISAAVLDLDLDGIGLTTLLQDIRKQTLAPILVVGGNNHDSQEPSILLEIGADTFHHKSELNQNILLGAINALIRRFKGNFGLVSSKQVIHFGPLIIDEEAYIVQINGREITLSLTEFSILTALARYPGRVVPKTWLIEETLNGNGSQTPSEQSLAVYISRIRAKIGDKTRKHKLIQTVNGLGYKLQIPSD